MPLYTFTNNKGESRDVFFHMEDEKNYKGESGDELDWARVWSSPNAAVSTRLDPFNRNQFVDKLGTTKGNIGDTFDRSAELSAARAEKCGGTDPVKVEYYKKAKEKRAGKECMAEIKERADRMKVVI